MQFQIDRIVIYDVENATLFNSETNASIALAATPARLLHYLILRHGQIVLREAILADVFDEHGARGTYSNLNQNVAMLRKSLLSLGCHHNIIETLPRVGLRIGVQIVITELESHNNNVVAVDNTSIHDSPRAVMISKNKDIAIYIMSLLFFLSGWGIYTFSHRGPFYGLPESAIARTVNIDNCNVKVLLSEKTAPDSLIRQRIEDFLLRDNLKCNPNDKYYYYFNQASKKHFNSFLVRCSIMDKSLKECRNSLLER